METLAPFDQYSIKTYIDLKFGFIELELNQYYNISSLFTQIKI